MLCPLSMRCLRASCKNVAEAGIALREASRRGQHTVRAIFRAHEPIRLRACAAQGFVSAHITRKPSSPASGLCEDKQKQAGGGLNSLRQIQPGE